MSAEIKIQADARDVDSTLARLSAKFRGIGKEAQVINKTIAGANTSISSGNAVRELRNLNRQFEQSSRRISATMTSVTNSIRNSVVALTGVVAALGSGSAIVRSVDSMTNLSNRIALVTGRGQELIDTQKEIMRISELTRTSMEGSTEAFNRYGLALRDSKVKLSDLLQAVENTQKAISLSGVTADSAAAAIYQLGQGLAADALRGQELNSVMEQTPRLAMAIATGMGITIGQLRKTAEEGGLTTKAVFDAILSQTETLDKEFAILDATVASLGIVFRDAAKLAISQFDQGLGLTETIKSNLRSWTAILQNIEISAQRLGFSIRYNIGYRLRDAALVASGIGDVLLAIGQKAAPIIAAQFRMIQKSMEIYAKSATIQQYLQSVDAAITRFKEKHRNTELFQLSANLLQSKTARELKTALNDIADYIRRLDVEKMLFSMYNSTRVVFRELGTLFSRARTMTLGPLEAFRTFYMMLAAIANVAQERLGNTVRIFVVFRDNIVSVFENLFRVIVGNSIWPDMFTAMYSTAIDKLLAIKEVFSGFFRTMTSAFKEFADSEYLAEAISRLFNFSVALFKVTKLLIRAVGLEMAMVGVRFALALDRITRLEGFFYSIFLSISIHANKVALRAAMAEASIAKLLFGADASFRPIRDILKDISELSIPRMIVGPTGEWRSMESMIEGLSDRVDKLKSRFRELRSGAKPDKESDFLGKIGESAKRLYDRTKSAFTINVKVDVQKSSIESVKDTLSGFFVSIVKGEGLQGRLSSAIKEELVFGIEVAFVRVTEYFQKFLKGLASTVLGTLDLLSATSKTIATYIGLGFIAILTLVSTKALRTAWLTVALWAAVASALNFVSKNLSSELVNSDVFENIGLAIGSTVGGFIVNVAKSIPFLVDSFVEVSKGFLTGFLDSFGNIGEMFSRLLSAIPGSGVVSALLFGSAFSLIFVKVKTLIKIVSSFKGLFAAVPTGVIGTFLFGGSYATILAGLVAVFGVLGSLLGTFNSGNLQTGLGSLGLVGALLFGPANFLKIVSGILRQTASLIFALLPSTMQSVLSSNNSMMGGMLQSFMQSFARGYSQIVSGFFSKSLDQRTQMLQAAITGVFASVSSKIPALKAAVSSLISLMKSPIDFMSVFLSPSTIAAVITGLSRIRASFISTSIQISATANAIGGPMGAVGSLLFGKVAKVAAISALILTLFAGTASAGSDLSSKMGGLVSGVDLGLIGLILLGGMTSGAFISVMERLFARLTGMIRSFFNTFSTLISSFTTLVIKKMFQSAFVAGILSMLTSLAILVGGFIAALFSPIGLAVTAVAGLVGYILFGDNIKAFVTNTFQWIRAKLTGITQEARTVKNEFRDMLDGFDKVGNIEIDLVSKIDEINLNSASDRQLEEIRKAIALATDVFRRNQQIYMEQGALTNSEQRETTRAVNMVEDAIARASQLNATDLLQTANEQLMSALVNVGFIDPAALTRQQLEDIENFGVSSIINELDEMLMSADISADLMPAFYIISDLLNLLERNARVDGELPDSIVTAITEALKPIVDASGNVNNSDSYWNRLLGKDGPSAVAEMQSISGELLLAVQEAGIHVERFENIAGHTQRLDNIMGRLREYNLGNSVSLQELRYLSEYQLSEIEMRLSRLSSLDVNTEDQEGPNDPIALAAYNTQIEDLKSEISRALSFNTEELMNGARELETMTARIREAGMDFDFNPAMINSREQLREVSMILYEISQLQYQINSTPIFEGAQIATLQKELEAARIELIDTIGTTEQRVSAVLSAIDSSVSLTDVMLLDPAVIERVIALGREIAAIMAMLSVGNLSFAIDAPVGGSIEARAAATLGMMRNQFNDIVNAPQVRSGFTPAAPREKSGGGGGGGGQQKSFWEEFREALSAANINLEDRVLGQLSVDIIEQLFSAASKYKSAQEAITASAADEVEKRRQSLEVMRQSSAELGQILMQSTLGGALGALESLGESFELIDLGIMSEAELSNLFSIVSEINNLQEMLANTNIADFETRKQITEELIKQKGLLEEINGEANDFGAEIRDQFQSGLSDILSSVSTLEEVFLGFLDTITKAIIDKFATNLTDILFDALPIGNWANTLISGLTIPKFNTGGKVRGPGSGLSDSILAWVSNGEYIVNSAATSAYLPLLDAINSGEDLPGYANGGQIGPIRRLPSDTNGRGSGASTQTINLGVTGDISRQTRKEILKMLPDIAVGVNKLNKERG
jgi:tape measure domain-containing protein